VLALRYEKLNTPTLAELCTMLIHFPLVLYLVLLEYVTDIYLLLSLNGVNLSLQGIKE